MCGFHGDGAYLGLSAHARLSLIPTFRSCHSLSSRLLLISPCPYGLFGCTHILAVLISPECPPASQDPSTFTVMHPGKSPSSFSPPLAWCWVPTVPSSLSEVGVQCEVFSRARCSVVTAISILAQPWS